MTLANVVLMRQENACKLKGEARDHAAAGILEAPNHIRDFFIW